MRRSYRIVVILVAAFLLLWEGAARAMFMMPDERVPVDRLIANVSKYVERRPKDAKGYYLLGRLHSLAYAKEGQIVEYYSSDEKNGLPGMVPWDTVQVHREGPLARDAAEHLRTSIELYRKAVKMAPKEPLYRLGLGWMIEQQALHAERAATQPATTTAATGPAATSQPSVDALLREAVDQYAKAVDLAIERDANGYIDVGDQPVSGEAADNAIRILRAGRVNDADLLTRLTAAKDRLKDGPSIITPIVFPLDGDRQLADLIEPGKTVTFDLAGDGVARRWPWVKGDVGILAWDPDRTGQITSGRQLFGSATWWMFWEDGYAALDSLDDDGDGLLAGAELAGIAVWQDLDGDGKSGKGEVTPVESLGVTAIGVRSAGRVGDAPFTSRGVRLRDGRWLPSYDWTPRSVAGSVPAEASPPNASR